MKQFSVIILHILSMLPYIDLDITLTKLYIHIPIFRNTLSNQRVVEHFQKKLGILVGQQITFPLLCVHLSMRKPLTSRIPLRVCLLLNVRYNYPYTDTSVCVLPSWGGTYCSTLIKECCYGSGGSKILGTERTLAFKTGRVTKYVRGILICLAQGGHYDSIVSLMDMYCNGTLKYDSVDMHNMLKEYMEVLVTSVSSFSQSLSNFDVLSKILSNSSHTCELDALMYAMYYYDRVDDIKYFVSKGFVTFDYIKRTFDCLSSVGIFEWLYTHYNYCMSDITTHCYPYRGSMLRSLKKLSKHSSEYNDEVIIAVIMSDDIESLVWLGNKGVFSHVCKATYTYLRASGITKEKLMEFSSCSNNDKCCVC